MKIPRVRFYGAPIPGVAIFGVVFGAQKSPDGKWERDGVLLKNFQVCKPSVEAVTLRGRAMVLGPYMVSVYWLADA